ncbi:MAG TPA: hypothetical protein EYO33_05020 [Phycisphaerales bacterium]|nr:hypothetical protein [Phycisphaerales bacterium]
MEKVFPLFGLRGKQKKQIVALRQEGFPLAFLVDPWVMKKPAEPPTETAHNFSIFFKRSYRAVQGAAEGSEVLLFLSLKQVSPTKREPRMI